MNNADIKTTFISKYGKDSKMYGHVIDIKLWLQFDAFDSATVGSAILGIGDVLWLSHDIYNNGVQGLYVLIAALFILGNVLLVVGLRQHHMRGKTNKARRLNEKLDRKEHVDKVLEQELNSIM